MITWYSPKDKMPEVGSKIVALKGSRLHLIYVDHVSESLMEQIAQYWAYATDFNFPKEGNE